MNKIILDLCGGTGCWSNPWKDAGYEVIVMTYPKYDVCKWREYPVIVELIKSNRIYGILAAPPCTMFSIARNDKTAKLPRDLREGMRLVNACLEIIHECLYIQHKLSSPGLKFWALENPYGGYLKRFLGKPSLIFHPYEFGDPYTKKTSLWGEFKELKKNPVKPRDFEHPTTKGARDFVSCVEHYADLKEIPDGYKELTRYSNRKIMRSMTPQGFAKAFFKANKSTTLSLKKPKEEKIDDFEAIFAASEDQRRKEESAGNLKKELQDGN